MPHRPSTRGRESVQFVSVSLTIALKSVLAQWAKENEADLLGIISRTVSGGYRVTCKEEDEGYSASMALVRLEGPNKGLVLVERGSTPERALLKLLWAHKEHFKAVWPRDKTSPEDDW